jgi:hypothetical protein
MFYRQKFVTNSSSTSFVAFGICLDQDGIDKICDYLIKKQWDKVLSYASGFLDGEDLEKFIKEPALYIEQNDMSWDLLDHFFSAKLDVYMSPGDMIYLTIGFPEIGIDDEGICFMDKPKALQKRYKYLSKLIKEAGLKEEIDYLEESWNS